MKARSIGIRIIGAAVVCVGLSDALFGQAGIPPYEIERVGQAGWQFLKINADPRQEAMGNAFTALSRGNASAVFGNPATLTDVSGTDVQLNNIIWIADIKHQSVSLAHSFGDVGTLALSFATLDYGDIAETINSPIPGDTRTEAVVTGNTYSARDMAVGLTYARKITENLSIGGSVRWLREGIAELSMTNWSFDFGTVFYTGFRTLRIAVAARNFGPDSRLTGWSEEYQAEAYDIRMPLDFRVGVAMDLFDDVESPHLLVLAVDGDHPNDGPEKFHIGGEYSFQKTFFLRGGYKFNYDEQGLTLGAGVHYPVTDLKLTVNYAYVNFGALTQVHMFSLGITL
jgi:hypothetical protein